MTKCRLSKHLLLREWNCRLGMQIAISRRWTDTLRSLPAVAINMQDRQGRDQSSDGVNSEKSPRLRRRNRRFGSFRSSDKGAALRGACLPADASDLYFLIRVRDGRVIH